MIANVILDLKNAQIRSVRATTSMPLVEERQIAIMATSVIEGTVSLLLLRYQEFYQVINRYFM